VKRTGKKSMMDANTIFVGCILGVLTDRLIDVYMHIKDRKKLWDELNAKFDASNAGNELYTSSSGLYLLSKLTNHHRMMCDLIN
jgi:hypothetical protein